jgi:hypothetical protein
MKKFVIEADGVEYQCCNGTDKVAVALRMKYGCKRQVPLLAFRNAVEVNGYRYVLRRIARFGKSSALIISIPSNVENIEKDCFLECESLCEVIFESCSKLREIDCAFLNSGVETIEIPDQCEVLSGHAIFGLKFVTISNGNKFLMFEGDLLFRINGNVLIGYFGNSSRVLIKNFIEHISARCSCGCKSVCEVVFESGSKLKSIGDSAFLHSRIKVIRIPNNVENIGKQCFSCSQSLCEVVFESESKLKEIGDSAFSGSGIKTIRIPGSVEEIGPNCFYFCRNLEIVFESESKLKEIGQMVFFHSGIRTIRIPNNVEKIGRWCFGNCLYEVVFQSESKLKEIGGSAFNGSSIEGIEIPSNVEEIGRWCFSGCPYLRRVVFESESKLKRIGDYAFSYLGIGTIRIPSNVSGIGKECFYNCRRLCEITFEGSPSIGKSAFSGCQLKCVNIAKGVALKYKFPRYCTIYKIDLTTNELHIGKTSNTSRHNCTIA